MRSRRFLKRNVNASIDDEVVKYRCLYYFHTASTAPKWLGRICTNESNFVCFLCYYACSYFQLAHWKRQYRYLWRLVLLKECIWSMSQQQCFDFVWPSYDTKIFWGGLRSVELRKKFCCIFALKKMEWSEVSSRVVFPVKVLLPYSTRRRLVLTIIQNEKWWWKFKVLTKLSMFANSACKMIEVGDFSQELL